MTEENKKQEDSRIETDKAESTVSAAEVETAENSAVPAEEVTDAPAEEAAEAAETAEAEEVAEEEKAEGAEVVREAPAQAAPDLSAYAFRWDYREQKQRDCAREKKKTVQTVLAYTLMVLGIFTCAFLLLSATLSMGGNKGSGGGTVNSGGNASTPTIDQTYGDHIIFVGDGSTAAEDMTLEAAAAKALPSTVGILVTDGKTGSGVGSGFIYTADGYIVTNYHVIEGMTSYVVQLYGGKRYSATVVGYDALSDIAVLKIDATGLIPADLGKSSELMLAESVLAIGSPIGISYAESVSKGIVSSRRRSVKIYNDSGVLQYTQIMIQIDNAVNPGNSGGPLVNRKGEVVGIVSKKVVYSNIYADGMGLVIPIDEGKGIIDALIAGQTVDNSALLIPASRVGISGENVTRKDGYAADGVRVKGFSSERFDAYAKLKTGDVILAIEGVSTPTIVEILRFIEDYAPGTVMAFTILRDGVQMTVSITLGSDALLN